MERDAHHRGRRGARAQRGEDALAGHPLRHRQFDAVREAVDQTAEQAHRVAQGVEDEGPVAVPRHPRDASVPVDLGHQVLGMTPDHLRRSGGSGTELDHRVPGRGRASRPAPDRLRRQAVPAAQRAGRRRGGDQHLRLQHGQRPLPLGPAEPVVQQVHLGAQPPAGQQVAHVVQRRRNGHRDGAAGPHPEPRQRVAGIGDRRPQRPAVPAFREAQAHRVVRTRQQQIVHPVAQHRRIPLEAVDPPRGQVFWRESMHASV